MTTETGNVQWVITGASQGFGCALATEVLDRGGEVLAVVRDTEALADLAAIHGARLHVVTADLRDQHDVAGVGEAIAATFGVPDVLVNNAGRAIVGSAEEVTMAGLREQLELNFFACAALTRLVIPGMRQRGSGTIVQLSSQGGRISFPGVGAYSASKFALEGWSEALAAELDPFGVRVMIVEPSRFRTGFNTAHSLALTPELEAYADVVGPVRADLAGADGIQEGDPARAAAIIADLVASEELPLRLPLGAEAVERISRSHRDGLAHVERLAGLARSADYPGSAPSRRAV
ncbi:SDR family NAD(P)-dependent oxidoreductase [Flexivirga caeni]|uniref:SDR family NAD(P)-dependent oxidoreductase n=1 Tax=Flexivirga caeni TaxID=2294115 RepID=A0A3M9LWS1_9MICO|nr:SDR family NAD(P)-dependent oxidoreductase [Flexivirga caeni]RNI17741.1 SDR family NAD(P)-dependent oxidoreductase [Flexivirga caeni]